MDRKETEPHIRGRFAARQSRGRVGARFAKILAGAAALAMVTASCSSSPSATSNGNQSSTTSSTTSAPPSLVTVNIAVPGKSSSWGFLYVAQQAGYFKQNGINAKVETVSVPTIIPGLTSGTFQATPLTGTVERAALKGEPVVDVMTVENRDDIGLGVDPGINSVSQLAGKTIVTPPSGTSPYETAVELLKKHGLNPTQVKFLPLRTVPSQINGFVSGQAQAIALTYDNVIQATAKVPGSKIIVTPQEAGPVGGFSGLAVSQSYLQQNPKVVSGMVKSILEAVKFVKTHKTKTEKMFETIFGFTKKQAATQYADSNQIYQLNPVPTKTELTNDAKASSQSGSTVTESQIATIWHTTIASRAYKQLTCPTVCEAS